MHFYQYIQHPCTTLHLTGRAPRPRMVNDGRVGINGKIGLAITTLVGTMICGYVFAIIALISLPSAITSHNLTVIIAWISSNFLQLVLLPIIIVGQNVISASQDARAEADHITLTTLHAINVQQLEILKQHRRMLERQEEILNILQKGLGTHAGPSG
jgi:hypothetical protein